MADKWAVGSGNWSNTATWNDGTLPGASDDVYADGKTVTIDQDVTVLSIRTTQRSGGTTGGAFVVASSRTISATGGGVIPGSSICLYDNVNSPSSLTVNGDVAGSATTNSVYGIHKGGDGATTINGNVTGGNGTGRSGVRLNSASTLNVTGNVTGGSNSTAYGIFTQAANGSITVAGNVIGGTAGHGINVSNTGVATTITGDVTGGGTATTYGVNSAGNNTIVNVTGDIVPAAGAAVSGVGRVYVNGNLRSHSSGRAAYSGGGIFVIHPSATVTHAYRTWDGSSVGDERELSTANDAPDYPAQGDVRAGVGYDGGGLTGTLDLPAEADVRSGVTYDGATKTGTVTLPAEGDVRTGTQYGAGGTEYTGTLDGGGGGSGVSRARLVNAGGG